MQWRRPTGDRLQLRLARVEQLRFLERDGQNMAQAALRWLLAQDGVHCVIPGARTVEQLEANIGAVEIYYEEGGVGPPLMMVPGLGGVGAIWKPLSASGPMKTGIVSTNWSAS